MIHTQANLVQHCGDGLGHRVTASFYAADLATVPFVEFVTRVNGVIVKDQEVNPGSLVNFLTRRLHNGDRVTVRMPALAPLGLPTLAAELTVARCPA